MFAVVKTGGRHHVGVPPAVRDDAGDIAFGIETVFRKHLRELFPHTPFHVGIGQREQLHTGSSRLLRHGYPGVAERVVHGQHRGFIRIQGHRFLAVNDHLPAQAEEPAVTFEPAHCGRAQFLQELPVAQRHVDGVHGRMVEGGHGGLVFRRQVLAHQPVHPLAAGHDDFFRPDLVQLAALVIDDGYALRGIRRTVVHHAGNGGGQAHAGRLAGLVKFLPVDAVEQHRGQGIIPLDGSGDHGLDEVSGNTGVAARETGQVYVIRRVFQAGKTLVGNYARLDEFIGGIRRNDVCAKPATHGCGLRIQVRRHIL